jgi:hypothetical protein
LFNIKLSISNHVDNIISACDICFICDGLKSKVCGEKPGSIIELTSTLSHHINFAIDANGVIVATILILFVQLTSCSLFTILLLHDNKNILRIRHINTFFI